LNSSIFEIGAREMATNETSRAGRCCEPPSKRVGEERAALAAFLPARIEHEVIDDELPAAVEEIAEGYAALGADEDVVDTLLRRRPS